MPLEGNLEYARARVQARYGMRPLESEWRRVETSRDLTHCLDALRASPLAAWSATLDASFDSHDIERTLRLAWRRYVGEIAGWHPEPWQPWIRWLAWLPTLPLITQLARPEPAPTWLLADPVCGPLAIGNPDQRSAALRHSPLAPLAPAVLGLQPLGTLWRAHWQRLVPAADADTRAGVSALLRLVDRFFAALAVAEDSTAARAALTAGLVRLFRACAETPVASVCHLMQTALDLQRLRGDLVNRRLFAPREANTERSGATR